MKQSAVNLFMDITERIAQESHAVRLKVGCIIVKEDRIVSMGYNGTPPGWDNCCEHETSEIVTGNKDFIGKQITVIKTKPEVIHAEANAVAKLARSTESGRDAVAFCTHAPCLECAKTLAGSGIVTLYYKYDYRDQIGLDHLRKRKINVVGPLNERTNA